MNAHGSYTFYTKVTSGTTNTFYGPFVLNIGCYIGMVTYADSPAGSFNTNGVAKFVGDATASVYTLVNPSSTIAYCTVQSSIAVTADETTPSPKINNCVS